VTTDNYVKYKIPESWKWAKLEDVCAVTDRDHRTPKYTKDGVPLISPKDFTEDGIDFSELKRVDKSELEAFKKKCNPEKGDILYSRIGTIGEARLLNFDFEFVALHSIALIKPVLNTVKSKYLLYLLQTHDIKKQALHNVKSVGTPDLGLKRIKNFDIPLAPFSKQGIIVAEIEKQFSRLDEAITALTRITANLKRYKASVLKAAVEGKLTEQWRKEHPAVEPASELLKRILTERRKKWEEKNPSKKYKEPATPDTVNLPELPKGWGWATLPQFGELNRGKSKHRPRNAPHLYGGPYPFVQTGDIKNATGVLREYKQTYSEKGLKQSRLWPKGTLCITIAANIADTAILGFDACFPDSIVGFTSDSENVDTRFVEYFFRTAKENIERFAPATAQKNINLEILNDLAIPLPPVREQQAIINEIEQRLSVTEEIEATIEINLKRADRLRQAILIKAFSGNLLYKDLNSGEGAYE